jgi:hypothetical protein
MEFESIKGCEIIMVPLYINEKKILADRNEEIVTAKFAGQLDQCGVGQVAHLPAGQILKQFSQILEQITVQMFHPKS